MVTQCPDFQLCLRRVLKNLDCEVMIINVSTDRGVARISQRGVRICAVPSSQEEGARPEGAAI